MKKIILLFIVAILFTSCTNNMLPEKHNSLCNRMLDVSNLGMYSFIPFTDIEIQTLSYEAKLEQRQIPEIFLKKMTTEALFYQFICCDLSKNMYMYNSSQAGFEAITKQLNMLPELLNRPDAGNVLVEILQNIEIAEIDGSDCFHFYECLQRITAQSEVINRMTKTNINQYILVQLRFQETIRQLSEINKNWSYPESLAAVLFGFGNIMLHYEFAPFKQLLETNHEINGFMNGANISNEQIVLIMNEYITKFKS